MKPLILTLVIGALLPVQLLFAQSQIADSFKDPTPNAEGVLATGFVPCSGITCDLCDFMVMANTIIKWLFGMAFLFFAVLAVRAGFKLVTEGNPGALQAAKQSFANAFIGLIIFLCAWLLIDTLLRTVLKGGTGEIDGWGPWTQVKCVAQSESEIKSGFFTGDSEFNPYTPSYVASGSGGSGGGSCAVVTDTNSPCHPSKLAPYFGSRANQASQICNKESGGSPVTSQTDRCCGTDGNCSGSKSFSGGFFQINILAHGDKIPGCNVSQMYSRNGNSAQGNPITSMDIIRNGVTIHTGWTCEVTNQAMYNTCMRAAIDPATNFAVAKKLFDQKGFQPWTTSAKLCGIPY